MDLNDTDLVYNPITAQADLDEQRLKDIKEREEKIKKGTNPDKTDFIEASLKFQVCNLLRLREYGQASELVVREIKSNMHIVTWRDDDKPEMLIYQDGKYINNGRTLISERIRELLGDLYSTNFMNQVIDKIKEDTYIDPEEFISECLNHRYEINVRNGIVVINPNDFSIRLEPHSPNRKFLYRLDIDYDKNASCDKIHSFFSEVFPSDEIQTIYEAIGVGLDQNLITKKAVFLFGVKDTGKTTALNLINEFYGNKNVSNLNLKQLTEKDFLIHTLFGKLANISNDISSDQINTAGVGIFKTLTGGDYLDVDRKFKTTLRFKNLAKFYFGANIPPLLYNADDAVWGRLMAFKFTKVFIDQNQFNALPEEDKHKYGIKDNMLSEKLSKPSELSGLLNRAIEGLIRYYNNNNFSYTQTQNGVMNEWIRQSDSFQAFFLDRLELGDINDDFVLKKDLYRQYHLYCTKHKVRAVSEKSITITLGQKGVIVNDQKCLTIGERVRAYEGLKFKEGKNDK